MGMFSWKCKGCGGELVTGEIVRMAGFRGIYDGYGSVEDNKGGSLDTNGSDYPSWHELCYQNATPEERVDDRPSENAPNQGFGYPRYEFLPRYEPEYYVLRATALVDTSIEDKNDDDKSPEWIAFKKEFPLCEREHCFKDGKFNPVFMGYRGKYTDLGTLDDAIKIAERELPNFPYIDIIAMGEGDGIIKTIINEEKNAELEDYNKRSNKTFQKFMDERYERQKREQAEA